MTLRTRDWFARLSHLRSIHPEWTTEPAAVRDQSGHSGNPRECPHGAAGWHPYPAYQGTLASSLPLLDRAYLPLHCAASIDRTLPIDRRRNKAYRRV